MSKKDFNPWPIGLGITLVLFCTIQLSMVTLATTSFEGLEDVEYYRHGVEYGQEIERRQKQKDLEWTIAHNLEQSTTIKDDFPLTMAILDADGKPVMHAKVKVRVGRSATLRDDREYDLKEVGPGIYSAEVAFGLGSWRLELEAEKGENLVKVDFRHEIKANNRLKGVKV